MVTETENHEQETRQSHKRLIHSHNTKPHLLRPKAQKTLPSPPHCYRKSHRPTMRVNIVIFSTSLWLTSSEAFSMASEAPSTAPTLAMQLLTSSPNTPSPVVVVPSQPIQSPAGISSGQTLAPTAAQTQDIRFMPLPPTFAPSKATRLSTSSTSSSSPTIPQTQQTGFQTTMPSTTKPFSAPSTAPITIQPGVSSAIPTPSASFQADSGMPSIALFAFAPSPSPTQMVTAAAGLVTAHPQNATAPSSVPSHKSRIPGSQSSFPSLSPSSIRGKSPAPSPLSTGSAPTGIPTQNVHFLGNNTASGAPSMAPSRTVVSPIARSDAPSAVPSLRVTALGAQSSSDFPSLSPSDHPSRKSPILSSDTPSIMPSINPSGLRARSTLSPAPATASGLSTLSRHTSSGTSPSSRAVSVVMTTGLAVLTIYLL